MDENGRHGWEPGGPRDPGTSLKSYANVVHRWSWRERRLTRDRPKSRRYSAFNLLASGQPFGNSLQGDTRILGSHPMDATADTPHVVIRPPLAWGLAIIAGLALNWLVPLPFLPADLPAGWPGAMVFVLALALGVWAVVTITRAGSNVPTNLPSTTLVESGPYRFTRNPIYLGMLLSLIGLAIAFNNLWLLTMLVPFALVLRYGVVAREEVYLERKFGDVYRGYRSRVRRWL